MPAKLRALLVNGMHHALGVVMRFHGFNLHDQGVWWSQARADRFGITKESDKADARAKRFGKPAEGAPVAKKAATSPVAVPALNEKMKARAARFGVPVPTK